MRLVELIPDAQTQTVSFTWEGAPASTVNFRVSYRQRKAPDAAISGETLTEMAVTSDPMYDDLKFFQKSILKREIDYIVHALDAGGNIVDTLVIRPMQSESKLIRYKLNAANYAAGLLFRNYNWSDFAYILRYRKTGQKCRCYNRDFEEAADPRCEICYGGGYVGGFYTPIPTKVLPITQVVKDQDIDEYAPMATDQRQITVPRFPAVFKGDFIVSNRLGYLSVVASSANTIQVDPTPTLMLTVIELGKDHIISKFKFDARIPRVDGVRFEDNVVVLYGNNIMPLIGGISLVIEDGPEAAMNKKFNITSIMSITPKEIRFRAPGVQAGCPEVHYHVFLNNMRFEG